MSRADVASKGAGAVASPYLAKVGRALDAALRRRNALGDGSPATAMHAAEATVRSVEAALMRALADAAP